MQNIKLINFIDLSLEQKEKVLEWRNHLDIRSYMYDTNEISLENHLNFIESLKHREDKKYFLVQNSNIDIGVIDFVTIKPNKSLDMGLYAAPGVKGVGNLLLTEIKNYAFDVLKVKTINAEVFIENERAYMLYLKYNFESTGIEKNINNKKVICMELNNENR
ncbi:UDP-4-amino-4,6-dideoxy-N-acetyl-beta-L-altrosamine N-acetyltransferase [Francisella adeliensis]|uniref:UDP-4-amino-4, 6-dideoxy-N-acetyl-beta-L-altrosamine N-acetyltransferase n=1 Tax=Francisella adeliensis TaxID=2007306 RepID=A0A2Z4XY93_9GAMM|nr:UDP-4-amino-4,6-dideoxy-N-acetyl-beta-L-altrosamine N-acetyltransferase [Francisella adeliensis]AXA33395.1 UDP-4-amino-4,6-dideoxy-N-acetyl-beta-L-altrosamine N-acetyltransferase [Francisella adeliensis]MBK2085411.1 UDP-4-amino-4,6-dideoxy-N-acetyl-beta-L-altrosamine N-acetyltransferase [Francisella adeliensis]MBK2097141.1 UDP-4-amino-4,6-dideoxy-N-acetyl-beta-L-altrosamine N-acetyltransferase [Francisella adeliensis]QIW11623.1 UDP-4-amino-4,6-dideoxy-N-acetyl-beta-L-altrosamine N-acetyltran